MAAWFPVAVWAAALVGPVLVWAVFRSKGYKREILAAMPSAGTWARTGERFVDPTTGEHVEVWIEKSTSDRAYVRRAADIDQQSLSGTFH